VITSSSPRLTRRHLLTLFAGAALAPWSRPAVATEHAMRVMVIGDSQAQGLAGAMLRANRRTRKYNILDHSKIATGLLTRSNYNWPKSIDDLLTSERPEVVVAMFGANDRPTIRINGKVNAELAVTFRSHYAEHVQDLVARIGKAKVDLIWVGHPIVRDPDYSEDMTMLNDIYAEAVRAAGGDWMPSWDLFADGEGGYVAHGKGLSGETVRLRADDGVHLSSAGYDLLADHLNPHIDYCRLQHEPQDSFPL
jgi:uncharacterized protein